MTTHAQKTMTEKQKLVYLNGLRDFEKLEVGILFDKVRFLASIVEKHGRDDTYLWLTHSASYKSSTANYCLNLVEIYETLPRKRDWVMLQEDCIVAFGKVVDQKIRDVILAEVRRLSKLSIGGRVRRCSLREIFTKHEQGEAANSGRCESVATAQAKSEQAKSDKASPFKEPNDQRQIREGRDALIFDAQRLLDSEQIQRSDLSERSLLEIDRHAHLTKPRRRKPLVRS